MAQIASSLLQKRAVENARLAFSHLPNGDARFQDCINQNDSIAEILKCIAQRHQVYQRRNSTRILRNFNEYTLWLQQISNAIDVAVQTQAGIGCPVSNNHSQAADQILKLVHTISEDLPRFHIYEKLKDPIVEIALVNVFTDVVEFSVQALQYFGRGTIATLGRLIIRPLNEEFGDIFCRLKSHTRIVDSTVTATELLKAAEFRKQTLKLQCQGWLKPTNVEKLHRDQVETRLDGTCDWIWSNSTFVKWNGPASPPVSDRLLCIYGIHGCGKSILGSSVITGLKQRQLLTLFFSFSRTDASRQSLDDLFRTLLWQLLAETTGEMSLEIVKGLMLKGPPTTSGLRDAFNGIAALVARPVYCVIDGVDECRDTGSDGSSRVLLEHVLSLLRTHTNFRVILLGRTHALQAVISATTLTIEINSHSNKRDIDAYISSQLSVFSPGELRDSVFKALQEKSDGMFLWVKLMISYLCASQNQAETMDRLGDLPRGLGEAYNLLFLRLTERLDKFQLRLARNVLTFTVTARRTLTLDELRFAHALERYVDASKSGSCFAFEEHLLTHPVQSILDACGDFINIKGGSVQLIHFSVKEFLTRPENEWLCEDQNILHFRVDLEASERSFGSICLEYLGMCEYGSPLHDSDAYVKLGTRYPFLGYASRYMISHLTRSGTLCSAILDKLRGFLRCGKSASWIGYLAMLVLEDESASVMADEFEAFKSWMGKGGYERKPFENEIRMNLNMELIKRIQEFGEHDPRTEQWRLFLDVVPNIILDADGDREAPTNVQMITLTDASTNLSHAVDALNSNGGLALHRQVDMILRLQSQLQRVNVLTDHLRMVFDVILRNAPKTPVYMLRAVGNFYHLRLDRSDQALKLYRAALVKLESRDIPIKFTIMRDIGFVHELLGKYETALVYYGQALEGQEKVLGKANRDTLLTACRIGGTYFREGQYELALKYYFRALAGLEEVMGNDHRDTLLTVYSIGDVYFREGQEELALKYYKRALAGQEKVMGHEHYDTLLTVYSMGDAYFSKGQYELALKYYKRTLAGQRNTLGNDDCCKLQTMQNIGHAYSGQGRCKLALKYYLQALAGQEKVLGNENRNTLQTASWIGDAYSEQGQYELAVKYYKQALAGQENSLGIDHANTVNSSYRLAHVLAQQGKYKEAEVMHRQTLNARERVLGKEHEETLLSAFWLACMQQYQEKYEEAEAMHRSTLEARERVLGKHHKDTLWSAHWLGYVLGQQEKYDEAETMHGQTLGLRKKVLGYEHVDTLLSASWLACVKQYQKKYEEAESMHRQTLEARERVLGKNHNETLWSAHQLAYVLGQQKKYKEAEALHRQTLEVRKRVLGHEHADTLRSVYLLGYLLADQRKYKEAEIMCVQSLPAIERLLGKEQANGLRIAYEVEYRI